MSKDNVDFLTIKDLKNYLQSNDRVTKCPYCGKQSWIILTDIDNPTDDTFASITSLASTKGSEALYYSIICNNCAHLSLINTYIVDKWFFEEAGKELDNGK